MTLSRNPYRLSEQIWKGKKCNLSYHTQPPKRVFLGTGKALQEGQFFQNGKKTGFPWVSLVGKLVHLGFFDSMLNHFAARPTGQELRPLQKGPNRGVDDISDLSKVNKTYNFHRRVSKPFPFERPSKSLSNI